MKVSRKLSMLNPDHHGSFLKPTKLLFVKKSCCRSWTAAERWLSHPSFQGQSLQKVKSAACCGGVEKFLSKMMKVCVFVLCHLMGGVGMIYVYVGCNQIVYRYLYIQIYVFHTQIIYIHFRIYKFVCSGRGAFDLFDTFGRPYQEITSNDQQELPWVLIFPNCLRDSSRPKQFLMLPKSNPNIQSEKRKGNKPQTFQFHQDELLELLVFPPPGGDAQPQ